MENWDTRFKALYHCQCSAQEGELRFPLCCCSAAGRSCICFEHSYIWGWENRWKMCFHQQLYLFPSTNIVPSCCTVHLTFFFSFSQVSSQINSICFEWKFYLIYFLTSLPKPDSPIAKRLKSDLQQGIPPASQVSLKQLFLPCWKPGA